ncbi:O-antigen ligase family protein [Eubacterium coprostanoligenes]|uniref:O-antigen ligase family protein n=1 Tax=Eubacterium coprostanoligenes TaxID=290054 RepID=UPI002355D0F7|nr:O-antigen ligase family protein [Eubacterium coprostanoligenes]MCI6355017.1 O-antigen ligase family protein [Eubacterium coprostanoligenes]
MTVFTELMGFTEFGKHRFYDNIGDLHGAFEYANAFAIYLLIAFIIALCSNIKIPFKLVTIVVCAYGIYKSNSRAVWMISAVMLVLIVLCYVFKNVSKSTRKLIVILIFLFGVLSFIILYRFGIVEKVFNYINTDGSFNERYLYYTDTLRYILKHPFGKGAYAFYFAQSKFQSAYYYAIDVHCDLLQYAIEIGVIPALLFAVVVLKQLFSKQTSLLQKLVLTAIMLHSLFDYDLQFISILFVLLLCFDYPNIQEKEVDSKLIPTVVASVFAVLYVVIGLSAFCNYIGDHQKSVYYYKNTPSLIILMQSTNDKQSAYVIAQEILKRNDSVYEPNNVMANIYSADNKYGKAIKQMELVIEKDPRTMQHYRDYIDLLVKANKYYEERGETEKSQNCKNKIASVDDMIMELKENTATRGILYGRKQNFEIGKKYKKIIKQQS